MKRICRLCGEEFEARGNRTYCYKNHVFTCPECGKQVEWNCSQPFKMCKQCAYKLAAENRKKTMTERYGAPTTLQSKVLKEKVKQTVKEVYGTDNVMQNRDVHKKAENTNLERYGAKNVMQNKDIAQKSAESRKENMDEIVQHIKEVWLEKYGVDNVSKCPEIIDKITDTFLKRYGVKRAVNVPEFRQKMIDTMMERYNVPYYIYHPDHISNRTMRTSQVNKEFSQFLTTNGIQHKEEVYVGGKFFDFQILGTNILIEVNPSYTHNIIGNHWGRGIDVNYHLVKTKIASENGYRCIHLWDWDNRYDIIDMLKTRIRIYARKCEIWKINKDIGDQFLSENHIQGACRGQILYLGLVHDGELVELMTLGKSRYNKNYDVELLRMCSKKGYEVVGGASKLFSYATSEYGLSNIISYCDASKFSGDVYEKIGMKFLTWTEPQEIWSKGTQKITANLLRARGYDQLFGTNYGKGTSNDQLMLEHGWLPVYDCGQRVYVY